MSIEVRMVGFTRMERRIVTRTRNASTILNIRKSRLRHIQRWRGMPGQSLFQVTRSSESPSRTGSSHSWTRLASLSPGATGPDVHRDPPVPRTTVQADTLAGPPQADQWHAARRSGWRCSPRPGGGPLAPVEISVPFSMAEWDTRRLVHADVRPASLHS